MIQLLIIVLLITAQSAAADQGCAVIEQAAADAAALRQLSFTSRVQCRALPREKMLEVFRARLAPHINEEKMRAEGRAYELIGFIPSGFVYAECFLEHYAGDTGAFYRPEMNDYVVEEGRNLEPATAVHELTHALQHQRLHLQVLSGPRFETSDALMAKWALFEGDATRIEHEFLRRRRNRTGKEERSAGPPSRQGQKKCALPPQLEELMAFPYDYGFPFTDFLAKHGGNRAVDEAFSMPPRSSSDVMHPDRYAALRESGSLPVLPLLPLPGDVSGKLLFSDRLGEFFIRVLLALHYSRREAAQTAANWSNDRLDLFRTADGSDTLVWRTLWNSSESALRFSEALAGTFAARSGRSGGVPSCAEHCSFELAEGAMAVMERKENEVKALVRAHALRMNWTNRLMRERKLRQGGRRPQ